VLIEKVLVEKTPILGICLGMQLMTRGSEEGELAGLNWIDARTKRFDFGPGSQPPKVPHMGWNSARIAKESSMFKEISEEPRFYFVHSYHVVCRYAGDVLAYTEYGYEFVSAFERENIVGVQFHPEKSHKFGMKLLKNFAEMV
jgi:glutamine amidotransferase